MTDSWKQVLLLTIKIISAIQSYIPNKETVRVNRYGFKDSSIRKPDIKRPEICDVLVSTAEIVFITPDIDKSELANQAATIYGGY